MFVLLLGVGVGQSQHQQGEGEEGGDQAQQESCWRELTFLVGTKYTRRQTERSFQLPLPATMMCNIFLVMTCWPGSAPITSRLTGRQVTVGVSDVRNNINFIGTS